MQGGRKESGEREDGEREGRGSYFTNHSPAMQISPIYLFVLLEHCPQMAETSLSKNVIETGGGNISMTIVQPCPLPAAGR